MTGSDRRVRGAGGKVTVRTQPYHKNLKLHAEKILGKKEESYERGKLGTRKEASR